MPRQELIPGVYIGSEISDVRREMKQAAKDLLEGKPEASEKLHHLARRYEQLLLPKKLRK